MIVKLWYKHINLNKSMRNINTSAFTEAAFLAWGGRYAAGFCTLLAWMLLLVSDDDFGTWTETINITKLSQVEWLCCQRSTCEKCNLSFHYYQSSKFQQTWQAHLYHQTVQVPLASSRPASIEWAIMNSSSTNFRYGNSMGFKYKLAC